MVIKTLLSDNGSQFTDPSSCAGKPASGDPVSDVACKGLAVEHRLCPARHPQTNGMVERFNGRISELMEQKRFTCAAELETYCQLDGEIRNLHSPFVIGRYWRRRCGR